MTTHDPRYRHICERILDRLYEYLNRTNVTPEDEEDLRQHLKACPPCGDLFDFEERLMEKFKESDNCECPERLRAKVKAILQGGTSPGESEPGSVTRKDLL